ncbi:MAG: N-methyl-L-tryptophan oxidase [Gemmatimonadetes bacterium]|nr:N-methyl-L-tryptophan oxidase [Gemmatimonadota bacterium]
MRYDAIVVGVGGMGSAALYHLARRGLRVLGLERFAIPHEMGSSHGMTRIIRLAYYEHPDYVPLLQRAYELWRDLERESGKRLLYITGSIDAGPPGSQVFEGSLASCRIHQLAHEVLTSAELTRRFPGYRLPANTMAVLQPEGGFLVPEGCINAHMRLAETKGATVHTGERVLGWSPSGSGVEVRTEHDTYEAARVVITAGAWDGVLVDALRNVLQPERQVLGWFGLAKPELFQPERFPVFNVAVEEGRYYGFPAFGMPGFKFGRWHHLEERTDPDAMDREIHPRDEALLRAFATRYFPDGAGRGLLFKTCLFTNTPDEHFIIDRDPGLPAVVFASACSGHGFKFCSVVGEILADLAMDGETRHEIGMFRLARFGPGSRGPTR